MKRAFLFLLILPFAFSCNSEPEPDFFDPYSDTYDLYMAGEISEDEAIEAIEKFVEDNPGEEVGFLFLGFLHERKSDWNSAEESFRSAIAINSKSYQAYNGIVFVMITRGQFDSSAIYLNKALELNSKNAYSEINLAVGQILTGDTLTALSNIEKSLTKERNSYNSAIAALIWEANGDLERSIEIREEALELNAEFFTAPGIILESNGSFDQWVQSFSTGR